MNYACSSDRLKQIMSSTMTGKYSILSI